MRARKKHQLNDHCACNANASAMHYYNFADPKFHLQTRSHELRSQAFAHLDLWRNANETYTLSHQKEARTQGSKTTLLACFGATNCGDSLYKYAGMRPFPHCTAQCMAAWLGVVSAPRAGVMHRTHRCGGFWFGAEVWISASVFKFKWNVCWILRSRTYFYRWIK